MMTAVDDNSKFSTLAFVLDHRRSIASAAGYCGQHRAPMRLVEHADDVGCGWLVGHTPPLGKLEAPRFRPEVRGPIKLSPDLQQRNPRCRTDQLLEAANVHGAI